MYGRVIAGIAGIGYSDHLEPDGPRRQVVEGGKLHADEVPEVKIVEDNDSGGVEDGGGQWRSPVLRQGAE